MLTLLVGGVAVVTGRARWIGIASRNAAGVVTTAGVLALAVGASVATPTTPASSEAARPTQASASPTDDDAAIDAAEATPATTALAALAAIEVKGRAPRTSYDRDLFGNRWLDVVRNGCATRNDILARDLTNESFKPGTRNCVVLTGTLADP